MKKYLLPLIAVLLFTQAQAQNTWIGTTNTDWNAGTNWSTGQVPTASDDVIIAPADNQPKLSVTGAVAQTVEVRSGATLTIESTGSLAVNGSKSVDGSNAAFYNNGTVQNSGQVQIGNLSSVGDFGLYNQATFNNNAGGKINIDRSANIGLTNYSGTFTNAATITIGANASVGRVGIGNYRYGATFTNNAGGQISIDRSSSFGLENSTGTFTNAATITIGANASVGYSGIGNYSAIFNNNTGGQISIDRSSSDALYIQEGTFTNAATITIGSIASVGSTGLTIYSGSFTNNTGGDISIDRSSSEGLYFREGTFTNASTIIIGANASVGQYGLVNEATFTNNSGGQISIDNSSYQSLSVSDGTFINAATITIGANSAGEFGLFNGATFFNNTGGQISIDRSSRFGLYNNGGTFTNAATITIGGNASVGGNALGNGLSGSFTNSDCATLSLFAPVYNQNGNLSNRGLMTVSSTGTHTNTGFTNSGVLVYPLGNPIPNVSNEGVIASPLSICGSQITPALQLGSSNLFTIGSTWYSNATLSQSAGTYSNNTFTASGLSTGTTALYFTVGNGNCTETLSLPVTLTARPGDPSVFGDNVWNVYAWNDGNGTLTSTAWQNNYRGYYTETSLSFDTRTKWDKLLSPSSAGGYQGCAVNNDNHSWSAKRKGFPCGHYHISIPAHDDAAQLFIDGVNKWEHDGCCDYHDNVWEGNLGPDSKVEFRVTEGTGDSYGAITFNKDADTTPAITAGSPTTICAGSVVLSSNIAMGNQWYTDNVLIPGATNQTYTATATGSYTDQVTSFCGNQTSNAINVTVTNPIGDPAVFGNGIWNVYAWNAGDASNSNGQSWNANYSGYYTESTLSFDTRNRWSSFLSPSAAQGYQGCAVGVDNHSWSAKRQGFECGYYQISIPGHDDGAQLYINGELVWQHIDGCCDSHSHVWEGFLGANDEVEFRGTEGAGESYGSITFSLISPTLTGISMVCNGSATGSIAAPVISGATYLWSPCGATTSSIKNLSAGTYSVIISKGGCSAPQTSFTIGQTPLITPTISGTTTICQGNSTTLTAGQTGPTVWNSGSYTFVKTYPGQTDDITSNTHLTRGSSHPIYNAVTETGAPSDCSWTPGNTEWAYGGITDWASLTYQPLWTIIGCSNPSYNLVNRPVVLHLVAENIYLQVTFTYWQEGGGNFTYVRTTGPTYSWSTGETAPTISVNTVGTYTLTIATGNGCTSTGSQDVTVKPFTNWYKDADNDGYSDGTTQSLCERPSGYKLPSELTATSGDCNDNDASINPGVSPTIQAPANITNAKTSNDGTGNCTTTVNLGTPVTNNNCTQQTIKVYVNGSEINPATYIFSKGTTTVTWKVMDAQGREASATQQVTVTDDEKPSITYCPTVPVQCYTTNSTYSVPALTATDNCDVPSVTYSISGATTRSGTTNNATGVFNPGTSTITWTVKDAANNTNTCSTIVKVDKVEASIPDVYASGINSAIGAPNTIYIGYGGTALTLTAQISSNLSPNSYTYKWTTGSPAGPAIATTQAITVRPSTTSTYFISVKDANNCSQTVQVSKQVTVMNITCGGGNVYVCQKQKNGTYQTSCINTNNVSKLSAGSYLGQCTTNSAVTLAARSVNGITNKVEQFTAKAIPNPSYSYFTVILQSSSNQPVSLRVIDILGRVIEARTNVAANGSLQLGYNYRPGIYIVEAVQGSKPVTIKLIKQSE